MDSDIDVAGLAERLERIVDDGLTAGLQLSVWLRRGSRQIDLAVGTDLPQRKVDVSHLFNCWCATRPITSIALLRSLEAADLSLDARVGSILTTTGPTSDLTCEQVLSHRAGLDSPNLLQACLTSVSDAISSARSSSPGADREVYSDFVSSVLIADLVQALTGQTLLEVLSASLEEWCLSNDVSFAGLPGASGPDLIDALGFFSTDIGGQPVPLYHDALPTVLSVRRDLFGGYASARGLCRFYSLVYGVLEGQSVPLFPSTASLTSALTAMPNQRPARMMGRVANFAGGFMTGMASHGFLDASDESIGHTGVMGSPFGLLDITRGLALAAIPTVLMTSVVDMDELRRRLLHAAVASVSP